MLYLPAELYILVIILIFSIKIYIIDLHTIEYIVSNNITSKKSYFDLILDTLNQSWHILILFKGEVAHYQIRRHREDAFFSIEEHTTVHGLDTLIQHYQGDSNGLVTRLAVVCKGQPPPHESRTQGTTNLLHR